MILNLLLAVAGGATLVFAFPNWNHNELVWLWMFPLLHALWSPATQRRPVRRGFLLGYIAGLAFFIPNLTWVRNSSRVINGAVDNHWMGWSVELMGAGTVVGLAGYLAIYWGLWGSVAATLGKARILGQTTTTSGGREKPGQPLPQSVTGALFSLSMESIRSAFLCAAAWVANEWLRGTVFTGFDWNGVAVPMASQLAMIQSADLVGVTGLAFLPVFCACISYNTVLRFIEEVRTGRVRPHADFFAAVVLVIANFGYGFKYLTAPPAEPTVSLRILLVQLNMSQMDRWSKRHDQEIYDDYEKFTRLALASPKPPDLVIWPESALPLPFDHPYNRSRLDDLLGLGDFSLLMGTDIAEPDQPVYTGAALLKDSFDNHQLYRKIHLVPFGEYVPDIPYAKKLLHGILGEGFASGHSTEPLVLAKPAGVQIIPLDCFEDTDGSLARKFVREAPQLMVNMTNDGWFLHSEENEQHLANAIFRCVEIRRPMARAANTGVTCLIGIDGRIRRGDRLEDKTTGSVFVKGAMSKEVKLAKKPVMTFYAKHGELASHLMLAITLLAVGWRMVRRLSGSGTRENSGENETRAP